MWGRHYKFIVGLCWLHNRVEFVNSWIFCDLLIEEDVEGIKGKQIEGTEFKICGKFSVQIVELEAGLEKLIIIWSVVLMVACDHNDGNSCCSLAEHDKEALVVEAVVSVKIIPDIAIDYDAMDLLFVHHWGEETIKRSVFIDVLLEMWPISQHNQIKFHVCVSDICNSERNEIRGEGDRITAASVPSECIVVEGFSKFDGTDFALMDECLIVVYVFGKLKLSDAAIDLLKASPSDKLDIRSIAL